MKIKLKIIERGFKIGYVAKQLGITPNCLSRKLKGKSEFTISEAKKLCEILDVPVNIFFE